MGHQVTVPFGVFPCRHCRVVEQPTDRVGGGIRKGVVVTTLSRNVERYHGDEEWRTDRYHILEKQRVAMVRYAQKQLGKEYNYLELAVIGIKIILIKMIKF